MVQSSEPFHDISISGCPDSATPPPTVTCFGRPVRPEFAAAERYPGEWIVSKQLSRAHLVLSRNGAVRTACGKVIAAWVPAYGLSWDGCVDCIAHTLALQVQADQPHPESGSLDAWLDEWLASMALARPRTVLFYAQKLKHIRPRLGAMALTELQPRDIRLALAGMAADGTSPTMLHHIHRTLTSALYGAKRERLIPDNPCVDVARPKRADFEAKTLTEEQAKRLVVAARGTKIGPLVVLALSTGMREGELLALTWDDVDTDTGLVTVSKTVQFSRQAGDDHRPGPTKTRSARRTVRIEGPALSALDDQRQRCAALEVLAPDWVERNLVFPAERGGYLAPSGAFRRDFHALLSKAGCPRIRFHDLRHTAGLFLTRSVGLVVASRILGHASPMITAALYGHSQQQDFEKASSAMAGILGAPGY
jgi:integrase